MAQIPLLPLLAPSCLPFVSLSTYLAPSRCDRNRPPPSQVACKLTPLAPLHPVDPPLSISQSPATPAPNNDDLGNILALGVQNTYKGTGYTRGIRHTRDTGFPWQRGGGVTHCRTGSFRGGGTISGGTATPGTLNPMKGGRGITRKSKISPIIAGHICLHANVNNAYTHECKHVYGTACVPTFTQNFIHTHHSGFFILMTELRM